MDFTGALNFLKRTIEQLSEYCYKAKAAGEVQPEYDHPENFCVPLKYRLHYYRWGSSRKMYHYILCVMDDV